MLTYVAALSLFHCALQTPSTLVQPYLSVLYASGSDGDDGASDEDPAHNLDDWIAHQEPWIYVQVPRYGLVQLRHVLDEETVAHTAWSLIGEPIESYEPIIMHAPMVNAHNGGIVVLMLPERCIGDFNDDGRVNLYDVALFMDAYLAFDLAADLNRDQRVNIHDQMLFLNLITLPCVNGW